MEQKNQKANGKIGPSFLIEKHPLTFSPQYHTLWGETGGKFGHFGFLCIYTPVQAGVPSEHGEFRWFYLLVSLNKVRHVPVVADLS